MGKELLELAYESAKEIPGAERCVLRLLDEQTSELTLRASLGPREELKAKTGRKEELSNRCEFPIKPAFLRKVRLKFIGSLLSFETVH